MYQTEHNVHGSARYFSAIAFIPSSLYGITVLPPVATRTFTDSFQGHGLQAQSCKCLFFFKRSVLFGSSPNSGLSV